jgi:hypothetical protein
MMVLVVLVVYFGLKKCLFPLPLAEIAEFRVALVEKLLGGEF